MLNLKVELNKINAEFKSRSKRIAEIKSLKKTVKKAKINNKCKVYCDLINHEFGKNLLKEFTIKSDLTLFDNLTFIPLVVDNINSIRISLKDSEDQDFELTGDKIIECELHFQKDEA